MTLGLTTSTDRPYLPTVRVFARGGVLENIATYYEESRTEIAARRTA